MSAWDIYYGVLFFILGSCIFSFLNVVVYRVPMHQNFVTGRSCCPACEHELAARDLFPVISYITLGGRCRYCKAQIGSRDLFVEITGGILAVICYFSYGIQLSSLITYLFFCVLTVVTLMDIDTMEIEDACHILIVLLAFVSLILGKGPSLTERLIGLLCISTPMLFLSLVVEGAFGGGDIKLMAACGAFLGWKMTMVSAFFAFLLGGVFGLYLLAVKKKEGKDHFAFGPFLCFGMMIAVFYGNAVLNWYFGYMVF